MYILEDELRYKEWMIIRGLFLILNFDDLFMKYSFFYFMFVKREFKIWIKV